MRSLILFILPLAAVAMPDLHMHMDEDELR